MLPLGVCGLSGAALLNRWLTLPLLADELHEGATQGPRLESELAPESKSGRRRKAQPKQLTMREGETTTESAKQIHATDKIRGPSFQ